MFRCSCQGSELFLLTSIYPFRFTMAFFFAIFFSIENELFLRGKIIFLSFLSQTSSGQKSNFHSEFTFAFVHYEVSFFFFCIYCLYICSSVFHFKNHVYILLAFISSIIRLLLSTSYVNYSLTISVLYYLISFIPSPHVYFITTIIYFNQHRFYFLYYHFVIMCGF